MTEMLQERRWRSQKPCSIDDEIILYNKTNNTIVVEMHQRPESEYMKSKFAGPSAQGRVGAQGNSV